MDNLPGFLFVVKPFPTQFCDFFFKILNDLGIQHILDILDYSVHQWIGNRILPHFDSKIKLISLLKSVGLPFFSQTASDHPCTLSTPLQKTLFCVLTLYITVNSAICYPPLYIAVTSEPKLLFQNPLDLGRLYVLLVYMTDF